MLRIQAIKPKYFLRPKQLEEALDKTVEAAAWEAQALFVKTAEKWTKKPLFYVRKLGKGAAEVKTDSKVYRFVDLGTKPHVIVPRVKTILKFAVGGSPKTKVRTLKSYSGKLGKTIAWAHRVNNPGIKARQFSIRVGEEVRSRKILAHELDVNLKRALR
jgi:hypothetical protein